MDTRNDPSPVFQGGSNSARSRRGSPGLTGPRGLIVTRARRSLLRFFLWQAGAAGCVVVSIVLDGVLRPSPGVELAWQVGAFFAALLLSWQGLAGFVPDLDRRWRGGRRTF